MHKAIAYFSLTQLITPSSFLCKKEIKIQYINEKTRLQGTVEAKRKDRFFAKAIKQRRKWYESAPSNESNDRHVAIYHTKTREIHRIHKFTY